MTTPDNEILKSRQIIYQRDYQNFDDICFTIFRCPSCGQESTDLTLLPIIDKEKYDADDVKQIQEETLAKIFDADFDFLHEKGNCNCVYIPLQADPPYRSS